MSEIQPTPIFNQDEILKYANNDPNKNHHHHDRGKPQSSITTPANSGNSGNLLQTTGTTQTFHEYATTCSNSIIDKLENLSMNNTIEINPASTQASSQNSEVFSHVAQNEMNDDQIAKEGNNDNNFNLKTSIHHNDNQKFTTINQIESQNLTVHITSLSHEHLNSQKLNLDLASNEPTNKINNLTDSQHSYITRTEEQSFISSLDPEHCFKLQRRRPCIFITPPNSTLKCGICQEIVCYPMVLECGHNACLYCINSNNRMGQSADQIGHHQNQNKINNNNHLQLAADNRNINQILNRNHYTEVNQVLSNPNNINFHLSNLGSVPPSHTQSAMIIPSLGLNSNNDQQTKMTPLDEIHSQYKNNNHQNLNLNFFQLKELNRFGRASLPRANNFQNRNKQFANMRDKNRDNAAIHHARIRGPISTDHGTTQNYNPNLQSSSHSIENILESHRTNLNLSPTNNNQNYNNNNNNSVNRRSSKNSANNIHRQDSSNKAQLQLNQAQDITNNNNKTSRHASDKFSLSGTGSDPEQVFCNICQKITNSTKIPSSAIQCQVMNLIIKCRNKSCSVTVKLCLRLIHEDKCQLEEVSCPNNSDCGIFLKRDLKSHLEVCKFFCCKYREFGCEFKGDKGEVDEHQKNCQYLVTEQASIYWFGVVFLFVLF